MMDIANALNVPEYRIGRVLKEKTYFDNSNHFVNHFRLAHAKRLLAEENSKNGLSSLATFNRVFKMQESCTPNKYRKASYSAQT